MVCGVCRMLGCVYVCDPMDRRSLLSPARRDVDLPCPALPSCHRTAGLCHVTRVAALARRFVRVLFICLPINRPLTCSPFFFLRCTFRLC
jgi:hypothetical protein